MSCNLAISSKFAILMEYVFDVFLNEVNFQGIWKHYSFLVRIKICATTMEINREVSPKIKNRSTL
jgi:hypothetical protein